MILGIGSDLCDITRIEKTLARIVGILMAGRAKIAATAKSTDPLKHVNGHVNGTSVDPKLLGTSARDAETVHAEPVADEDRFVTQSKKAQARSGDTVAKPPAKGAPNNP